jgi:RND family efflux transporter MFP subunit
MSMAQSQHDSPQSQGRGDAGGGGGDGHGSGRKGGKPFEHVGRYALILLVVALILGIWGIASRVHSRNKLGKETNTEAIPVVVVQKPVASPPSEDLVLPGSVQAFVEAPIYARTSGYLKTWYTDIGDHVKKGQVLADIEAPEVDQQYRQSQADLATAQANANLAKITDVRWKGLLANQAVSQQDADTRAGQAAASEATEASARANVARLRDLESFKRVVAPFEGVVTARNIDIGDLINAGQSPGSALFRMADVEKLRVYVTVPEPYASQTKPGIVVWLRFTEHPGKDYPATLVRTAQALDPIQRTLLVEVQVDNHNGELFPGSFAEVHFKLPGSNSTVRIPANALIFRTQGLQVASVGPDNRAKLSTIVEGRDFGTSVEVLSGVSADDRIIINPPDSLADGGQVRIQAPPQQGQQGQGKGQQAGQSGQGQQGGQGSSEGQQSAASGQSGQGSGQGQGQGASQSAGQDQQGQGQPGGQTSGQGAQSAQGGAAGQGGKSGQGLGTLGGAESTESPQTSDAREQTPEK